MVQPGQLRHADEVLQLRQLRIARCRLSGTLGLQHVHGELAAAPRLRLASLALQHGRHRG